MPITEHQRQARRSKLGSSDAPAIVGVSPWLTAQQVYWSKKVDQPDTGTVSMQTGNRMEKPLVEFAEDELRYGQGTLHEARLAYVGYPAVDYDAGIDHYVWRATVHPDHAP